MALAPTLIVSVGGAGFQTLCYLKSEFKRILAEAGWHGELPKAWQFVAIDVQPMSIASLGTDFAESFEETHNENALGGISYINLISPGTYYDHVVQLLQSRIPAETFIDQISAWLPRKTEVLIEMGSGQFSSIGRAIFLSSLDRLAQGLSERVNEMLSPQTNIELQRVNSLMDTHSTGIELQPVGVVLSSLAGGFGSSSFLDVEKLISDHVPGGLYSFLYSPSVFRLDISADALRSTLWNALSSLSAMTKDFESGDSWGEVSSFFGVSAPANKRRCRFVVAEGNNSFVCGESRFEIFKETAAFVAKLIGNPDFAQDVQRWNFGTSRTNTLVSPTDYRRDQLVFDSRRHGGLQHHSSLVPAQRALGISSFQDCLTSGIVTAATNPFDSNVLYRTLRPISEEFFAKRSNEQYFRTYLRHARTRPLIDSIPLPNTKLKAYIKGWTLAQFFHEIKFESSPDRKLKCSVLANNFGEKQDEWICFQEPSFRSPNSGFEGDSGLIATIKSLGLAFLLSSLNVFGPSDVDALFPYQVLVNLGELSDDGLPSLIEARGFKGDNEKDIYALKTYLTKMQKNLEQAIDAETMRLSQNSMDQVSGRYELKNWLFQALVDLVKSVDSHTQGLANDDESNRLG